LDGHYDGGVPRPCHVAAASSKQLLDEELLTSDMKKTSFFLCCGIQAWMNSKCLKVGNNLWLANYLKV
jgi:hypothetical protein